MKGNTLAILFIHLSLLSFSQVKDVDSMLRYCENEHKYSCSGPIIKTIKFEENKMAEDKEYLHLISELLLQKWSFKKVKRELWKEKATHYIQKYETNSNKIYKIFFDGNYIKGIMLLLFKDERLESSGLMLDNSYRRFCWDTTGVGIDLIDLDLVRNVILPIIPHQNIEHIGSDMWIGDYDRLFSMVVGKSGEEVKH